MSLPTRSPQRPSFVSSQVTDARRYFLNLTVRKSEETVIVCGGCERVRPDYEIRRTDFPYHCVEFVAEGQGELELAGRHWRLCPGMAFSYLPGIPHSIRSDPRKPMLKYYVDFIGRQAERFLAQSSLGKGAAVQVSSPEEVVELFEALQRNGLGEGELAREICAALLPVLLFKITEKTVTPGESQPRALETYRRARRLIEARFTTLHNVEAAAKACSLDAAYLCRLFQRFGHLSPLQFLTRLKMNRASELLLDGGLMVKEAAAELGFADAFHFSRAFKRIYGLSPERFVRQARGRAERARVHS